jgi:hypothetical protein
MFPMECKKDNRKVKAGRFVSWPWEATQSRGGGVKASKKER